MNKQCTKCGVPKAITSFKLSRGHRGTICRPCRNKKTREQGRCYHCYKQKNECQCKIAKSKRSVTKRLQDKELVIKHYGGKCQCPGCEENRLPFLTIDHINGDGSNHRKLNKHANSNIWEVVIKENFPETYQVLCWNCNCSKSQSSVCPVHSKYSNSPHN